VVSNKSGQVSKKVKNKFSFYIFISI